MISSHWTSKNFDICLLFLPFLIGKKKHTQLNPIQIEIEIDSEQALIS